MTRESTDLKGVTRRQASSHGTRPAPPGVIERGFEIGEHAIRCRSAPAHGRLGLLRHVGPVVSCQDELH